MNKINSIYATEVGEIERNPLKANFSRFSSKLEKHIKETLLLRKTEHLKQSQHLMEQLCRIKERSGTYRRKLHEQESEFHLKVQSLIQQDIDKFENDQQFFAQYFRALQAQIRDIGSRNGRLKQEIQLKTSELKKHLKQHAQLDLPQHPLTSQQLSTIESSLRLSRNRKTTRIRTDPSLPTLHSNRYDRFKTVVTEQGSPRNKPRKRSGSYMQPIGSIKTKEQSSLSLLADFLDWYSGQEDLNDSWFLKVIFTPRNYVKLKSYLSTHSGTRIVIHKK